MDYFNHNRIQELIDNGYDFDIGKHLSDGFEFFKKEVGLFIGFTVIVVLILFATNFLPYIGGIIVQIITPPLMAGYLIGGNKADRNEMLDFSDLFKGFDHFAQLIVYSLIILAFSLIILLPLGLVFFIFMGTIDPTYMNDMGSMQVIILLMMSLVVFILFIYMTVSYVFTPAFIVFGQMQAWDAMEASRKIVAKNFFPVLGLTFVLGIMVVVGYLLCCVGLLVALPVYQLVIYAAFSDLMGFNSPDVQQGGNDIYNHLVD